MWLNSFILLAYLNEMFAKNIPSWCLFIGESNSFSSLNFKKASSGCVCVSGPMSYFSSIESITINSWNQKSLKVIGSFFWLKYDKYWCHSLQITEFSCILILWYFSLTGPWCRHYLHFRWGNGFGDGRHTGKAENPNLHGYNCDAPRWSVESYGKSIHILCYHSSA